jgi:hypothetical protein
VSERGSDRVRGEFEENVREGAIELEESVKRVSDIEFEC